MRAVALTSDQEPACFVACGAETHPPLLTGVHPLLRKRISGGLHSDDGRLARHHQRLHSGPKAE